MVFMQSDTENTAPSIAHDMNLTHVHPNGDEEWHCPVCGRRMRVRWSPDFQRTLLTAGDEAAIHRAGKGGLSVVSTKAAMLHTNVEAGLESWAPFIESLDINLDAASSDAPDSERGIDGDTPTAL
jgi:hypothetical protein